MEPTPKRQLTLDPNPLTAPAAGPPAVELCDDGPPPVYRRPASARRQIIDARRHATAAAVLRQHLDRQTEIYGFTKGQFSIIDLIDAALDFIGAAADPADLILSTWTAANVDVTRLIKLIDDRRIERVRFLVDLSFQRRQPELAQRIRQRFGRDSIRVAKNHAKFYTLKNRDWRLVIRTSMNINFNPRFEDFTIAHDPQLYEFLAGIIGQIWHRQKSDLAFATPYKIDKAWQDS